MARSGSGHDDPARSSRTQTNLTAQTASGLSWFYLSTMTLMVANLAYTATVSRLLAPAAFGLMAIANLVVLFIQFFVRMGLASALVQKPDLSEAGDPGRLHRRHRRRPGLPGADLDPGPSRRRLVPGTGPPARSCVVWACRSCSWAGP